MWDIIRNLPPNIIFVVIIFFLALNKISDFLKILVKTKEAAIENINTKTINIDDKMDSMDDKLQEITERLETINMSLVKERLSPVICPLDQDEIKANIKHLYEQHNKTTENGTPIWYFPNILKVDVGVIIQKLDEVLSILKEKKLYEKLDN